MSWMLMPNKRQTLWCKPGVRSRVREISINTKHPEDIAIEFVRIGRNVVVDGMIQASALPLSPTRQGERSLFLSASCLDYESVEVRLRSLGDPAAKMGHGVEFTLRVEDAEKTQIEVTLEKRVKNQRVKTNAD